MELKIPSLGQAYWGLRAMKTVALEDGKLDDSERHMMEAVQRSSGPPIRWKSLLLSHRPSWHWRFRSAAPSTTGAGINRDVPHRRERQRPGDRAGRAIREGAGGQCSRGEGPAACPQWRDPSAAPRSGAPILAERQSQRHLERRGHPGPLQVYARDDREV